MKISAVETVTEKLYVESNIDETLFDDCKSEAEVMDLLEDIFYDDSEIVDTEHVDTESIEYEFEPILEYWRNLNNLND